MSQEATQQPSQEVAHQPSQEPGHVLTLRTTPPPLLGRAARLVERNALANRRAWMIFVSGLFEPVFYLFAMGVGVAALVGEVPGPDGQPVSYGVFVAPALLAVSAMNGGTYESTFNVFAKLKWGRVYDAVLATPLTPRDVAVGELTWALVRGSVYAVGFLLVATVAGLVTSPWAVLALPAATLIGFAFAGMGLAATSYMRSWQDFDLVQLVLLPLLLFSATFYPLEVYPEGVRWVVWLSPLYHGVEVVRAAMLGVWSWLLPVHVVVLAGLGSAGLRVAIARFDATLRT
ncbi:MAG: ABC transporter permease [Nitriliruptoraceae bacterium]